MILGKWNIFTKIKILLISNSEDPGDDKSDVTKLAGNNPSPRWFLPFHQFLSELSIISTKNESKDTKHRKGIIFS